MTLEQKIRDVLARLSTLSEANASNLEPRTSHGKSSSRAPAGVSSRIAPTDPDRPPPKERSLFDWYSWMFDHTDPGDVDRLLKLWLQAERDYYSRTLCSGGHFTPRLAERRSAVRAGGHLKEREEKDETEMPAWPAPAPNERFAEDTDRGADDEREAARQVVDLYEGQSAEEAAVIENVPIQVIHKARKLHKRNADDGRPRPPFLDWDDAERQRQVDLLIAREKAQDRIVGAKVIAKHFGVDKNTVKRYLEPATVAA